jgi:hypothetical protein
MLARCLVKQNLIRRTETEYINPLNDINYLKCKKIENMFKGE